MCISIHPSVYPVLQFCFDSCDVAKCVLSVNFHEPCNGHAWLIKRFQQLFPIPTQFQQIDKPPGESDDDDDYDDDNADNKA